MLFWGIWAPPIGPKQVLKGSQVNWMYVLMSKFKNKPLTKSKAHSCRRNSLKQPENSIYAVLGHFGTLKWTQKGTQRPASGQDVCLNALA
jgi:hypothetical protein